MFKDLQQPWWWWWCLGEWYWYSFVNLSWSLQNVTVPDTGLLHSTRIYCVKHIFIYAFCFMIGLFWNIDVTCILVWWHGRYGQHSADFLLFLNVSHTIQIVWQYLSFSWKNSSWWSSTSWNFPLRRWQVVYSPFLTCFTGNHVCFGDYVL